MKPQKAVIHYHDIGDYLDREQKLTIIKKYASIAIHNMNWEILQPDIHGDWISQRNDVFDTFIPLGDKDNRKNQATFFVPFYSNGVKTNRDAWVYNFSFDTVCKNTSATISFYNQQLKSFQQEINSRPNLKVEDFIDTNPFKISWSRALREDLAKNKQYNHNLLGIIKAMYRPFCKLHLYFDREIINDVALLPKIFPLSQLTNSVICVSGVGVTKEFSTIITDTLPDLELIGKSQCFPLYYYEQQDKQSPTLFDYASEAKSEYIRRDGVSDFILDRAHKQYGKHVSKEDIFYYVYGILHSPEYRTAFANDLKKQLPRLPLVEDVRDFWKFSKIGRKLADLHVNYETVPPHPDVRVTGAESEFFKVEKMRFPARGQKDTIIYNSKITVSEIPAVAYEYVVNGKSAIEWVMERYQVTTHKESGIVNDPNDWAAEVGNPRYILDLLLSVINLSVQTVELVRQLPKIKFE